MRKWRRAAVISLAACLAASFSPQRRWQVEPDAADIERWVSGAWSADAVPIYNARDFSRIADSLTTDAERWSRAGGPEAEPRRRQQAAVYVLDLVLSQGNAQRAEYGSPLSGLFEWAHGMVAAGAPSDAERLWTLAALAWHQRRGVGIGRWEIAGRTRFPDEARFVLARALTEEQALWPQARDLGAFTPDPAAWARLLARYREAAEVPAVAAEARFRVGLLELRRGRPAAALDLFRATGEPSEPWLRYLRHLFEGQAQEAAGDIGAAERAYRAAFEVFPLAQSATLGWAAALRRTGQPEAAATVTTRLLAQDPPVRDPWQEYLASEWRHLDGWLQDLRAMVRR